MTESSTNEREDVVSARNRKNKQTDKAATLTWLFCFIQKKSVPLDQEEIMRLSLENNQIIT